MLTIYKFGALIYIIGQYTEARIEYHYENGTSTATIYYSNDLGDEWHGGIVESRNGTALKDAMTMAKFEVRYTDHWTKLHRTAQKRRSAMEAR